MTIVSPESKLNDCHSKKNPAGLIEAGEQMVVPSLPMVYKGSWGPEQSSHVDHHYDHH